MRNVFGHSYPPGCSGPPEGDESCSVCGAYDTDQCVCAECPECGTHGDPHCYRDHGMTRTTEQVNLFKARQDAEDAAAKAEADWLAKNYEEEQAYFSQMEADLL